MRFDLAMQNKWLRGGSIAGVHFPVWQHVTVIAGPHEGKVGKLISLFDMTPEPVFQMETSDGGGLHVRQSEIERLAHGLAGACLSFAADDTERAARALMDRATTGDIPSLRTLVERVEAALGDLTSAL